MAPLRSTMFPLLQPSIDLQSKRLDPGNSQEIEQEFDFTEVFGAVVSSVDETQVDDSATLADDLAAWAPLESISGGEPLVINHRSHSLVGPAYSQPSSLSRNPGKYFLSPTERREVVEGDTLEVNNYAFANKISEPGGLTTLHSVEDFGSLVSLGDSSEDECAVMDPIVKDFEEQTPRCPSVTSVLSQKHPIPTGFQNERLDPSHFELLRVVGQGAFGKVFQVQKKDTGEILAMKVMKKDKIMERNHSGYMQAERDILTKAVHPFIVQLQYSFQTKTKLYLLLDFINGGHLFFQLYRQGTFSEDLAKIYTAEIVLAVAHLHQMGVMHRDLKPENILLDSEGHVVLTDFGLAKEVDDSDKSNSLCGTMEYMAPEIILAKGHGRPADWWSVGILLYEMLTGQPPYAHKNRQKLQQKIVKDKIKFPTYLTSEANNLLKGLLQKDPSKRLGSGPNGSEDVKGHKWFKGINWTKLLNKEIHAKFCPTVNGKHCTANFDERWTTMPVQDSPAGTPTSDGIDFLNLRGYTYVAPRDVLPTVNSDSDESNSDADAGSDEIIN